MRLRRSRALVRPDPDRLRDGIVRIVSPRGPGGRPEGGHAAPVLAVSFDPIGRYVASADVNFVNIWKFPENRLVISYRPVQRPAIGVLRSPNGRFLAVWLDSGKVALIDLEQFC
jgi:hypothetical protein